MKMKQLESMMEVDGVEEDSELVMRFPRPYGVFDAGENLISVRDASFAWSPESPPLFEKVDFTVGAKARITILGKNGCGTGCMLKPTTDVLLLSLI
jgi:ATPase subunit of ABC transporter with duplicated ATPase domains